MRLLPVSVTVAATALALVGAAPTAHAGAGYQYSFTSSVVESETTSGVGDDTGVCEPIETVTLTAHEALHATATQAGLDQEGIEALLDDDPDGVILRATYTETGTFVAEEGGHTYTGHFTQWFGGGRAGGQFVFSFTFTVVGTSELGTPISAHFVSHFVGTDDVTKVELDRGQVLGCLPAV
jgi:hypothetical protein